MHTVICTVLLIIYIVNYVYEVYTSYGMSTSFLLVWKVSPVSKNAYKFIMHFFRRMRRKEISARVEIITYKGIGQ